MWRFASSVRAAAVLLLWTASAFAPSTATAQTVILPIPVAPAPRDSLSPSASAVKVTTRSGYCSGTVIASEGGKSLVVTCAHCFRSADRRRATDPGGHPVAGYSVCPPGNAPCLAVRLVAVDEVADLALLSVDAALPAVRVAHARPVAGAEVQHWGISSGPAQGVVLYMSDRATDGPTLTFRSSLSSIPGDSGAGVFANNELVAVNWGYGPLGVQRGTLATRLSALCKASATVQTLFPVYHAGIVLVPPQSPDVPPSVVPTPPVIRPPVPRLPSPIPRQPLFPRLRKIFGR